MEIVRKKICLEDFTSRIPSKRIDFIGKNGNNISWGKIAGDFSFGEKKFKYSYVMNLYYETINLLKNSNFLKKINSSYQRVATFEKKWSDYMYYYGNGYKLISLSKPDGVDETEINVETEIPKTKSSVYIKIIQNDITFYFKWCSSDDFITTHFIENRIVEVANDTSLSIKQEDYNYIIRNQVYYYWGKDEDKKDTYIRLEGDLVVVLDCEKLNHIKSEVKRVIGNENLFQFINEVDERIGKYITPSFIFDNITPLYFYDYDLDDNNQEGLLKKLEKLTEHIRENKQNKLNDITFQNYGGDVFFGYLKLMKGNAYHPQPVDGTEYNINGSIDIPLLITSKLLDLGQYKVYPIENEDLETENKDIKKIVNISGESKLKTLASRRAEFDDYNNVIIIDSNNANVNPYELNKVRNIREIVLNPDNNSYEIVGDAIISMVTDNNDITASTKIDFIYVIGGKFKLSGEIYSVIGGNPMDENFELTDDNEVYGMWYKETYNLTPTIITDNNIPYEVIVIDSHSKEETYSFDGIDYERHNFIMCDNIKYCTNRDENYTNFPIFYDEKMLGLTYPLKEKYDVTISRDSSAAFEKHLQLTEVKTMQDLEHYRNGSLLK